MHLVRRSFVVTLATALAATPRPPARAADAQEEHCADHAGASMPARYTRSTHRYELPSVTLLDQEGHAVPLERVLATDAPLALNFIFTTCTTICPVMSATFAEVRRRLGSDGREVRLVSISIDPAHDRPGRLKEYGRRFGADGRWSFYTGTEQDVARVLTAFQALEGDKTNHRPVTLLRRAAGEEWIRIEGLARAEDLARELRALHAGR